MTSSTSDDRASTVWLAKGQWILACWLLVLLVGAELALVDASLYEHEVINLQFDKITNDTEFQASLIDSSPQPAWASAKLIEGSIGKVYATAYHKGLRGVYAYTSDDWSQSAQFPTSDAGRRNFHLDVWFTPASVLDSNPYNEAFGESVITDSGGPLVTISTRAPAISLAEAVEVRGEITKEFITCSPFELLTIAQSSDSRSLIAQIYVGSSKCASTDIPLPDAIIDRIRTQPQIKQQPIHVRMSGAGWGQSYTLRVMVNNAVHAYRFTMPPVWTSWSDILNARIVVGPHPGIVHRVTMHAGPTSIDPMIYNPTFPELLPPSPDPVAPIFKPQIVHLSKVTGNEIQLSMLFESGYEFDVQITTSQEDVQTQIAGCYVIQELSNPLVVSLSSAASTSCSERLITISVRAHLLSNPDIETAGELVFSSSLFTRPAADDADATIDISRPSAIFTASATLSSYFVLRGKPSLVNPRVLTLPLGFTLYSVSIVNGVETQISSVPHTLPSSAMLVAKLDPFYVEPTDIVVGLGTSSVESVPAALNATSATLREAAFTFTLVTMDGVESTPATFTLRAHNTFKAAPLVPISSQSLALARNTTSQLPASLAPAGTMLMIHSLPDPTIAVLQRLGSANEWSTITSDDLPAIALHPSHLRVVPTTLEIQQNIASTSFAFALVSEPTAILVAAEKAPLPSSAPQSMSSASVLGMSSTDIITEDIHVYPVNLPPSISFAFMQQEPSNATATLQALTEGSGQGSPTENAQSTEYSGVANMWYRLGINITDPDATAATQYTCTISVLDSPRISVGFAESALDILQPSSIASSSSAKLVFTVDADHAASVLSGIRVKAIAPTLGRIRVSCVDQDPNKSLQYVPQVWTAAQFVFTDASTSQGASTIVFHPGLLGKSFFTLPVVIGMLVILCVVIAALCWCYKRKKLTVQTPAAAYTSLSTSSRGLPESTKSMPFTVVTAPSTPLPAVKQYSIAGPSSPKNNPDPLSTPVFKPRGNPSTPNHASSALNDAASLFAPRTPELHHFPPRPTQLTPPPASDAVGHHHRSRSQNIGTRAPSSARRDLFNPVSRSPSVARSITKLPESPSPAKGQVTATESSAPISPTYSSHSSHEATATSSLLGSSAKGEMLSSASFFLVQSQAEVLRQELERRQSMHDRVSIPEEPESLEPELPAQLMWTVDDDGNTVPLAHQDLMSASSLTQSHSNPMLTRTLDNPGRRGSSSSNHAYDSLHARAAALAAAAHVSSSPLYDTSDLGRGTYIHPLDLSHSQSGRQIARSHFDAPHSFNDRSPQAPILVGSPSFSSGNSDVFSSSSHTSLDDAARQIINLVSRTHHHSSSSSSASTVASARSIGRSASAASLHGGSDAEGNTNETAEHGHDVNRTALQLSPR